ncbi:MAG: hypothetical protein Q9168_008108 [Polycauliona sp. 1 TL-2023]
MVATRSQDKEPGQASPASALTPRNLDKRKRTDDTASITTPNTRAKKSKLTGDSSISKKESSRTLAAVVIPTTHQHEANVPSTEYEVNGSGNNGALQRLPQSSSGNHRVDNNVEPGITGTEQGGKDSRQPTMPGIKQAAPSTKSPPPKRRKSKKAHPTEPHTDDISSEGVSALNKTRRSRHKRFESEEALPEPLASHPSPPSTKVLDVHRNSEDAITVSSDDEAPEVVTKSSGQQEARSIAAEASKAIEMQRAAEKQRRRVRDRLLKSQSKISKIEAAKLEAEDERSDTSPEFDEDNGNISQQPPIPDQRKETSRQSLPALLPDEILAAEPTARMPTPPPRLDVVKATVHTKHRFLDQISKPPKDIQKGNVRIRVLEDRRAILPPRVSKNSQKLRESWLAGRRGHKGKVVMERRKMGTGFVRR